MTRLTIRHETTYTYCRRVKFGPHRVVLRPREGHDLRVDSMLLDCAPRADVAWTRDVFGNSVALLDFRRPAALLRILSQVEVTRGAPYPHRQEDNKPTPFPPQYDALEVAMVSAYRALTYPEDAGAVAGWVARCCPRMPKDTEKIVALLTRGIRKQIHYKRREEKGVLTPAETIAQGAGSCRDQATLLLDAARSLGIAARFASGYLDCAATGAGYGSTHAWVEIYLPGHGWRGYDPSLGTEVTHRHVATGLSNHPRGVMPVAGTYFGRASDFLGMKVSVRLTEK